MELPPFRYHPDPIKTGSIRQSDRACCSCGEVRGYVYVGPTYGRTAYDDCICPWCIADGTAQRKLRVEFADAEGVGGLDRDWERVPRKVVQEIAWRTPGFISWQGEEWFTHCKDAAAFLGHFGYEELAALGPEAIEAIRASCDVPDDEREEFIASLDKDGSPTAYLFQCLHCGAYGGYSDFD